MLKPTKHYSILFFALLFSVFGYAQLSIPWSSSVSVSFGQGTTDPGPPLSTGTTDFIYTTDPCPTAGYYTIVSKQYCPNYDTIKLDAGHIFLGPFPLDTDPGYMMMITHNASPVPKTIFAQTVKNLCSNNPYLFWVGLKNIGNSCIKPDLTFNVETTSGVVIKSYRTGDIVGASSKNWYPGYYYPASPPFKPPNFPYWGMSFSLPPGVTDIVVKILESPSSANSNCTSTILIDNILLTPLGPNIKISDPVDPDYFIKSACFEGGEPVILHGEMQSGYLEFGTPNFVSSSFANPAFQWQQSIDNGFTWTDVSGETNLNFSHVFSIADTFLLRVRAADAANIGNLNCNVVSNIMKIQVDGLPTNYKLTSNSPVCTDGDLIFKLQGGDTYTMSGPNGFFDNTPFSHRYGPSLADSGTYYAHIMTLGGCTVIDSTHVVVVGPNVKVSPDTSVCSGTTLQLQSSGGNVYTWSPSTGLSSAAIPNPLAKPDVTTTYELKVTDQSGCSDTTSVTLTLLNGVLKAAIAGPDIACPKDITEFKNESVGNIVSWHWDFGNGQTSADQNPSQQKYFVVDNSSSYQVKLTVTDSAGCVDTASHLIKAVNNCYIAVPSAFTPDGDGHNDYLYPLNAYKATNLVFRVYNRSGQLVFETMDWTRKWDGNFGGTPQATGTFVWTLNYTDADNKKVSLKGTTVLIR